MFSNLTDDDDIADNGYDIGDDDCDIGDDDDEKETVMLFDYKSKSDKM